MCGPLGGVVGLHLPSLGISTFPVNASQLSGLTYLNLSGNGISEQLPGAQLAALGSSLRRLDLSDGYFYGG